MSIAPAAARQYGHGVASSTTLMLTVATLDDTRGVIVTSADSPPTSASTALKL